MVIEMYLSHLKSLCSEHPDFVEFLCTNIVINLCYSESKDREQIGTINLRYCYVSRSVPNEMDRFGLVLGEYKKAMFSPDSAPPSIGLMGFQMQSWSTTQYECTTSISGSIEKYDTKLSDSSSTAQ
ncbi:hypothetical protein BSLG_006057 [Batrachochytrium salamandrivorans]|nr:hypothetical protein BSLG_006057 [Batrachochytrium salamandrivorans]